MYSCHWRFLVKMSWIALLWREDSVNSSRMLIKWKHLVMELCVMVEGFCLWNVCNKNNKASETYIVSLYFLSLELLTEKVVKKTFWGFVPHSGNHFTVILRLIKTDLFMLFESGCHNVVNSLFNKISLLYISWFPMNNLKLLFWL